jgi:hypothetical protein
MEIERERERERKRNRKEGGEGNLTAVVVPSFAAIAHTIANHLLSLGV